MKSITIHKLDDRIVESIEARAREKGESLNATIKQLLAQALNIETGKETENTEREGYRRFLGKWTADDAAAFNAAIYDFESY